MILIVFYYTERIIRVQKLLLDVKFTLLKQDIQSQWGLAGFRLIDPESHAELSPDLQLIDIQETYCETFWLESPSWLVCVLHTACPLDDRLWAEICKIVLKLKDADKFPILQWRQGQVVTVTAGPCPALHSQNWPASKAKQKQRSVELETDCRQLHMRLGGGKFKCSVIL